MKEYIEREAAIRAVQRYGVGALDADDFSPEQAERFIISNLSAIPAADVVEVRHEKWTPAYYGHVNYVRCTGCGSYFEDSIFAHEDSVEYCPHCGAKMDGGVNDGKVD